jgi:hypothetical protein
MTPEKPQQNAPFDMPDDGQPHAFLYADDPQDAQHTQPITVAELVEYMEASGWALAQSSPIGALYEHRSGAQATIDLWGEDHEASLQMVRFVAQTEGIPHAELRRRIHAMHAPDATIRALGCAWLLILAAIGYVAVGVVVGMLR